MNKEVLVIDKDPNVCSALMRLLRSERLPVTATTSGTEAVKLMGQRQYAVLLCDQQTADQTGLEVMAEAQNLSPQTIKVLMVSQMAEVPGLIRKSPGLKFQVMMKPWSNMGLIETVNHAIKRHHMLLEAEH